MEEKILENNFFFLASNLTENVEKLLIIIHGSGQVRAGQWSRYIFLQTKTQQNLPFEKLQNV